MESQSKTILARGNSDYVKRHPSQAAAAVLFHQDENTQLTLLPLRVFPQKDFLLFLCKKVHEGFVLFSLLDILLFEILRCTKCSFTLRPLLYTNIKCNYLNMSLIIYHLGQYFCYILTTIIFWRAGP